MKWKADKSLKTTSSKRSRALKRKLVERKEKNQRFLEGFASKAHEEQEGGNICVSDYNGYGYVATHMSRDHACDPSCW